MGVGEVDTSDTTGPDNEYDNLEISEAAKESDCPDTKSGVSDITEDTKESSSSKSVDTTQIAPEVRKRLEAKWEKILGPKYKIIVSKTNFGGHS